MVLVTGAAGNLGSALVRELLSAGEKVRALVLPGEDVSGLQGLDVEIVKGNVLEPESIRPAFDRIGVVYHLAGIISIMPGRDDLMRRVNVTGTSNVARIARKAGVSRMVYVSSIHALGRPPAGTLIDESVPFNPHNPAGEYDRTKAEASLLVLAEVQKGLDAVIVCPTGIIGPSSVRGGSLMGRQLWQWMKPGAHAVIDGHFDFVDVRDVARGMILAARHGRKAETYILSGARISVGELFSLVQEAAGVRGLRVRIPFRVALLASWFATMFARIGGGSARFTRYALETLSSNSMISREKAHAELGYSPRPIRQTIMETVLWLKMNSVPA